MTCSCPDGDKDCDMRRRCLIDEQIDMPLLKRVIVVYGKRVAREKTAEEDMEAVFR